MLFADLKLSPLILRALDVEGYKTATPIQAEAIPQVLAGRDVLGSAQTGTGKTAAFALPILNKLAARLGSRENPAPNEAGPRLPVALILCPTRELAAQIGAGFKAYGREIRARYSVIFGGVSQGVQIDSLRSGVDVIIATPGRLLDLINQNQVNLSKIQTLVLDEADRMLDMGFIHDIKRVVARLPAERQTLMFSATMPNEIKRLAESLLKRPVLVAVAPVSQVADRIAERVYFVPKASKPQLLAHLVKDLPMYRAIVFTRTKHGADRVVRKLEAHGIPSAAIHGNKSQNNRNRALHQFKNDKIGVLVATDIAARGIDIDGVTHVVNYDLTHEPETYVHRIGRTARAGASGTAVSFCDHDERVNLTAIERLIKRKIEIVDTPHDDLPAAVADPRDDRRQREGGHRRDGDRHTLGRGVRRERAEHGSERQAQGDRRPSHGDRPVVAADRRAPQGERHVPHQHQSRPHTPSSHPRSNGGNGHGNGRGGKFSTGENRSSAGKPSQHRRPAGALPREFPSHGPARHPLQGSNGQGSHGQRSGGGPRSAKKPHRKGPSRSGGRPHSHASGRR